MGPGILFGSTMGVKGDFALCITDQRPAAVVAGLETLDRSPERRVYYAMRAREAAERVFNPAVLQRQFLDAMGGLVDSVNAD